MTKIKDQHILQHEKPFLFLQAGSKDNDLVALLVYQLFKELFSDDEMPSDIAILQAANALLDEQNGFSTFLTTDRHAKPLGIMTVTNAISLKTGESYAIIIEIYVSPSQRSKGVGDFMIEHLSIMGKSLGWTHIETLVPQKGRNVRAIGFFRQCGFKRIATAMTLKLK